MKVIAIESAPIDQSKTIFPGKRASGLAIDPQNIFAGNLHDLANRCRGVRGTNYQFRGVDLNQWPRLGLAIQKCHLAASGFIFVGSMRHRYLDEEHQQ
jgi:hypothetical protein